MRELSRPRRVLLCIAVLAQVCTIAITWPLWQVRIDVPNLPVADFPQLSFGILMLISLVAVLIWPTRGAWGHLAVLLLACLADQTRLQPQFFTIWALLLATADERATPVVRWYLVTIWLWTGAHKFLSPDWYAHCSFHIGRSLGLEEKQVLEQFVLAIVIAGSEVVLGILAWVKPRWGTIGCLMLHLGIAAFLSPLGSDWNYSVIPWNFCMALIGGWILWQANTRLPKGKLESRALIVFLIIPAGFYAGLVDRSFAHVLYSKNYPSALITKMDGSIELVDGWGDLAVPFPPERRLFRQYFELTAEPGEKLHIFEPRVWLEDEYLIKRGTGNARSVSRATFHQSATDVVEGIELDSSRLMLFLSRAGVTMKRRTKQSMVFAVAFDQDEQIELLPSLGGLPNTEQLMLNGTSVDDSDLEQLPELLKLSAIGLNDTNVTKNGLAALSKLPSLNYLEFDGRSYSGDELRNLIESSQE